MTTYNFCAGPAMLPVEVMLQAQEELINWHGRGCSIMEMSHRGKRLYQSCSASGAGPARFIASAGQL